MTEEELIKHWEEIKVDSQKKGDERLAVMLREVHDENQTFIASLRLTDEAKSV